MRIKQSGKSSQQYYKRILAFTSLSLFVLVSLLTAAIAIFSNFNIRRNIKTFETGRSTRSLLQTSDYFEQLTQYMFYISELQYIPTDQLDTSAKLWQQRIYSNNITAIMRANSHIAGINLSSNDFWINQFSNEEKIESTVNAGTFMSADIVLCRVNNAYWLRFEKNSPENNLSIRIYLDLRSIANVTLDDDGYLTSNDGTVLLAKDHTKIGKNLYSLYGIDKESVAGNENGEFFRNRSYYVAVSQNNFSDMKMFTVIPKSRYFSDYFWSAMSTVLVGIMFLMFAITVTFYFIKKTYEPIKNIVETFRYHLPYNMGEYENDVKFINDNIEATLKHNEQLSERLEENITKLQQAQTQVLQMQISPHFVMNTLENVKQVSVEQLGMNNPIENSLVLLSTIINQSVRQNDIFSTVKGEIELSKCYLQLMQNRYKNRFEVYWNVEPQTENYLLLKFTLQPILENIFSHGFHPRRTDQWIQIGISETQQNLIIKIANNGRPIEKETVEELLSSLKTNRDVPRGHVGLQNVQLRTILLFGENYGITDIKSGDERTEITLTLPKKERKKD